MKFNALKLIALSICFLLFCTKSNAENSDFSEAINQIQHAPYTASFLSNVTAQQFNWSKSCHKFKDINNFLAPGDSFFTPTGIGSEAYLNDYHVFIDSKCTEIFVSFEFLPLLTKQTHSEASYVVYAGKHAAYFILSLYPVNTEYFNVLNKLSDDLKSQYFIASGFLYRRRQIDYNHHFGPVNYFGIIQTTEQFNASEFASLFHEEISSSNSHPTSNSRPFIEDDEIFLETINEILNQGTSPRRSINPSNR